MESSNSGCPLLDASKNGTFLRHTQFMERDEIERSDLAFLGLGGRPIHPGNKLLVTNGSLALIRRGNCIAKVEKIVDFKKLP